MNEREKLIDNSEDRKAKIRARYKGISKDELEFIPAKPKLKIFEDTGVKRVCAYCRVSTDDPNQTSSYELQKNHYEDMIKEHVGWELVGIYADEGISGTSLLHREQFNQMMADCRAGKIDIILTKSVSRFARNIVDCIAKQRELANMNPPVRVFFETEHIDSLDSTSEMMMAVLAAAAQEESHTKSEIMNISIEQRFSRGIFLTPELLGYDKDDDGNLVINEEEAETVRLIYYLFLNGFPTSEIAQILMDLGRKTKLGRTKWSSSTVSNVIQNERHCGDVLSRKTFTPNYLDHKAKKNRHDRNQYKQSDHHEAIVSHEIFDAAQKLLKLSRYRKKGYPVPNLSVVDDGLLRGFVPVNRTWSGFSSNDYVAASESAYETYNNSRKNDRPKKQKSHFKLRGYEVVWAQYFSTRINPAMTISHGQLTFNTSCLRKFDDIEYVELLFNSVEKCIAIRPCDKDDVNAIRWGSLKNGKWCVLPKSCRGFSEPLYQIMDWNKNFKYRFRGEYHELDGNQVMIFDLAEPEIMVKNEPYINLADNQTEELKKVSQECNNATGNVGTSGPEVKTESAISGDVHNNKGNIVGFNRDWLNHFGYGSDSGHITILERVHFKGNWDVLRPARIVEKLQIIDQQLLDYTKREAEEMINNLRRVE